MSDNSRYRQHPVTAELELRAENLPAELPATWERALEVFLDARSDSPHTRRAYRRQITAAMSALGVVALDGVDGEALAEWRAQVAASDLSAGSQAQALAAVRSFLRFTRGFGLHRLGDEVIRETLRTPRGETRRPYQVLADWEIAALLEAAGTERDRAIVALLIGGGLRAAELVGSNVDDLTEDQDGELVALVRGKGRKERVVPLRRDVARILRRYIASSGRRLGDTGPLFLSDDPAHRSGEKRLSTRAVGYLLARLVTAAGIDGKRISPHSTRHTYAIRALRAGASAISVQKLLGHASVATTQRYLDHLETAELRSAVPDLPA